MARADEQSARWKAGQRTVLLKKALYVLAAVALTAGLVVGILELAEREDRQRPMHHDTILMAGLQYDLLKSGRPGVEMSVDDGSAPVLVGGKAFTPLPGIEIVVEQRGESFCVKGSNQYGDETQWMCVDGTGDRPDLGILEDEF